MDNLLLEILKFSQEYAHILTSLAVVLGIVIVFSKSIKKHFRVFWIILLIPFTLIFIQYLFNIFNIKIVNFYKIPLLRAVFGSMIHMNGFGFQLLVIIMFIGALNPKNKVVKGLLNIRKELSILVGFPVLAHALIRVTYTFPRSFMFFVDMPSDKMKGTSLFINGLLNFGYCLGVFMMIIFLMLWITSFDSVHRKLGAAKWKKIQKWAYVLYAMIFVHALCLNIGWMYNGGILKNNGHYILTQSIEIFSILLIFSSYLYLRLRKYRIDKR